MIILIILTALVMNIIMDKKSQKDLMSFKESLDLTDLPIVTFYNNNHKVNFLLDTGSSHSIINQNALENIIYHEIDEKSTTFGMEGNKVDTSTCNIEFFYKKTKFNSNFTVIDMSRAFDCVKEETGVTIHGILGCKFFEEYGYILDFNNLVAYHKK